MLNQFGQHLELNWNAYWWFMSNQVQWLISIRKIFGAPSQHRLQNQDSYDWTWRRPTCVDRIGPFFRDYSEKDAKHIALPDGRKRTEHWSSMAATKADQNCHVGAAALRLQVCIGHAIGTPYQLWLVCQLWLAVIYRHQGAEQNRFQIIFRFACEKGTISPSSLDVSNPDRKS